MTGQARQQTLDLMLAAVVERLPAYLPAQRWFAGKEHPIESVQVRDSARLLEHASALLVLVDVHSVGQPTATYFLPLLVTADAGDASLDDVIVQRDGYLIHDGLADPAACRALLRGIAEGHTATTAGGGCFAFQATASRTGQPPLAAIDVDALDVRRLSVEQSNSSIIFGRELILKAFRRTQEGVHPEVEILRFLGERTDFVRVPRLLGWADYESGAGAGASMPVGVLQAFVPNEGDGWAYILRLVSTDAGTLAVRLASLLADLGTTLAELHLALASQPADPTFAPESITVSDVAVWRDRTLGSLTRAVRYVDALVGGSLQIAVGSEAVQTDAEAVRAEADVLRATIDDFALLADGLCVKTRHHGDFHLGQTLIGPTGWTIIDFEGEPLRPLAERRAKQTPLRDVAGLLRSLDYAEATVRRQGDMSAAQATAFAEARQAFLASYVETIRAAAAPLLPQGDDDLARVLRALEIEKALYELSYEVGNRPDWVAIPLGALARLASPR